MRENSEKLNKNFLADKFVIYNFRFIIKFMLIAIDARCLEGNRTGVGRVLFNVLREWSGGKLSEELRKKKIEILLYFKNGIPEDAEVLPFEKKILSPILKDSNFLFQHLLLPLALRRDGPDAFWGPAYLLPYWGSGLRRSVVTMHDVSFAAHPEWESAISKFFLGFFARRSAVRADRVITVSQFSKEEIKRLWKIGDDKIIVSYPAPDPVFRPFNDEEKQAIRKKYNLKYRFVIFVGSFFTRRRIPELIMGFESARRGLKVDWQLALVGQNHTRPFTDIKKIAREANLRMGGEMIKIMEKLIPADLPVLYSASGAAVYISDYEGFGLPVLEAMSSGTPVITSKKSSLPEAGGRAAYYLKENTPEEISAALKRFFSDDSMRRELVVLGQNHARRFSWEKTADIILKNLIQP